MDNTYTTFDRAKFDAVWRRVMPESAHHEVTHTKSDTGADDTGQLRDFMDDEYNDAQIYCTLASMCSGSVRQTLLRISEDERRHLKRLRARYFILTGQTYTPPCACPLIYSVRDMLRKKYTGEKEGSAAYKAAADRTSNEELADTYRAHAEDEARHSKTIGCVIESIM